MTTHLMKLKEKELEETFKRSKKKIPRILQKERKEGDDTIHKLVEMIPGSACYWAGAGGG